MDNDRKKIEEGKKFSISGGSKFRWFLRGVISSDGEGQKRIKTTNFKGLTSARNYSYASMDFPHFTHRKYGKIKEKWKINTTKPLPTKGSPPKVISVILYKITVHKVLAHFFQY